MFNKKNTQSKPVRFRNIFEVEKYTKRLNQLHMGIISEEKQVDIQKITFSKILK